MTESKSIWEQQPDEPSEWFSRFLIFKGLKAKGISRSVLAAYNAERGDRGLEKTSSAPKNWRAACKTWKWVERAAEWDINGKLKEEKRWERGDRQWRKRQKELRDKQWELHMKLIEKAEDMLDVGLENQAGGDERPLFLWKMGDVPKFLEVASMLGKAAIAPEGMPELVALKVLVDAGWIPEHVLDVASDRLEDLRESVMNAFIDGAQTGIDESLSILSELTVEGNGNGSNGSN